MPTKTVALDQIAYEILKEAKGDGESFSDAVRNLASKRKSILSLAGSWSDVPEGFLESMRKARRKSDSERGRRLQGRRTT